MADPGPADIVRLIYLAALGRSPDPYGLKQCIALLEKDMTVGSVVQMLRDSLYSEEARHWRAEHSASVSLLRSAPPAAGKAPIRYIFSGGSHCLVSTALDRLGLRPYAGPFDWLFSSPAMVSDCLRDDFAGLLDPAQHRIVPVEERVHDRNANICDHLFYRDRHGIRFVFNHFDMTDPLVAKTFRRRVDRLRAALQATARTILIVVCEWKHAGDFSELAAALDAYGPNNELLMLAADEEGAGRFSATRSRLSDKIGSHRLVEMRNSSKLGGLGFGDVMDDVLLARIVQSFPFDLAPDPLAMTKADLAGAAS